MNQITLITFQGEGWREAQESDSNVQQNKQRIKYIGVLLVLLFVLGSTTSLFQQFIHFPTEIRMFQGQENQISLSMPTTVTANVDHPSIVKINGQSQTSIPVNLNQPLTISSNQTGHTSLTLRLFGKIPVKKMDVNVYPNLKVIPGGQSIGVKLKSNGVMVVGHHLVSTSEGKKSPGEEAKIEVGDYIVGINGQKIHSTSDVSKFVKQAGEQQKWLQVEIIRNGKKQKAELQVVLDDKDQAYRIGLYIRDSAAGVGTLTFIDPKRNVYGALGHVISDMDTRQPIQVREGKIVHSSVTSIQKGESGEPGEKRAIFFQEDRVLGNIVNNTPFGIFGSMHVTPNEGAILQPIPVAFSEEVKEGPAQILTVVEGQKVESFQIQISHAMKQKFPATKGLIIKVTDPRLLAKTGGIVQGMSGSPIIQNGKLIGAVTHVFVNDPSSGYGTYIEWMLRDAGVIPKSAETFLGSADFGMRVYYMRENNHLK